MKTGELKKKLVKEINLSKNKVLLEELYQFLSRENNIQEPYTLNREQGAAVREAQSQMKNGDYLENQEANQKIYQWLNE